ncbi:MAG TPA: DUF4296 domain-containing protein [Parafilimonas sp.]|nr:DUF4296 domain-containing protein [Parafilimonas sp.]
MKKCFLYCIVFSVFVACMPKEKKIPKDILPIDKMKIIVWQMAEAGAYAEYEKEKKRDTSVKTLSTASLVQVLKLHNLTKEDFFKSFNFYQSRPLLNKELFDSVNSYAQRQRSELYKRKQ